MGSLLAVINKLKLVGIDLKVHNEADKVTVSIDKVADRVKTIPIPNGVQKLISTKNFIFNDIDYSVDRVILPESLEIIGEGVFNKTEIKEINIPIGLKKIEVNAFRKCEIGRILGTLEHVESIEGNAFMGSSLSGKIEIGASEKIGTYAFSSTNIVEVDLSKCKESCNALNYAAFCNCTKLRKVILHDEIKYIGGSSFICCANIEEINIPKRLLIIGEEAFRGSCRGLKELDFSKSMIYKIEKDAFRNTGDLKIILPYDIQECEGFCDDMIGKDSRDIIYTDRKWDLL